MRFLKTLSILIVTMTLVFVLPASTQQKPFTEEQISNMVRAGLGDDSGAKLIEQHGIDFAPTEELIQTLKTTGASEAFLHALRAANSIEPAKNLPTAPGGGPPSGQVAQTQSSVKQVQDLNQLVGKRVIAQRMPLCEPGPLKTVIVYAGKPATVISTNPSETVPALSQSVLEKIPIATRAFLEEQKKAATVLVQFEDGSKLDTCGAIGPARISLYFELAAGETLAPPAQSNTTPVASTEAPQTQPTEPGVKAKAKKEKHPYQVGIFVRHDVIDEGTVSEPHSDIFGNKNVTTKRNIRLLAVVKTPDGEYAIRWPLGAPVGFTWFMDDFHPGDKVVFSADCLATKDPATFGCFINVLHPDNPNKHTRILGTFTTANVPVTTHPQVKACGTGKLTPEAESELCH
jgi:hypothetical protein